jgi:hypothetical protein
MRTFLSEEALVAAYWRKLARSIERPDFGKRGMASLPSVAKHRNRSISKSRTRPGVRQRFAGSEKLKPALATRRPRG